MFQPDETGCLSSHFTKTQDLESGILIPFNGDGGPSQQKPDLRTQRTQYISEYTACVNIHNPLEYIYEAGSAPFESGSVQTPHDGNSPKPNPF